MYLKSNFLGLVFIVFHFVLIVSSTPLDEGQGIAKDQRSEDHDVHPQKRSLEDGSQRYLTGTKAEFEEMAILKDLILSHVVSEMQSLREHQQEEELQQQHQQTHQQQHHQQPQNLQEEHGEHHLIDSAEGLSGLSKKKRFFLPLTGRPEDLPAMKRQIRYHQCYFNPISCFRRK